MKLNPTAVSLAAMFAIVEVLSGQLRADTFSDITINSGFPTIGFSGYSDTTSTLQVGIMDEGVPCMRFGFNDPDGTFQWTVADGNSTWQDGVRVKMRLDKSGSLTLYAHDRVFSDDSESYVAQPTVYISPDYFEDHSGLLSVMGQINGTSLTVNGIPVLTAANNLYLPRTNTGDIQLAADAGRTISINTSASGGGKDLTIKAGDAWAFGGNASGGSLILSSGAARGATGSQMLFQTAVAVGDSSYQTPQTRMMINNSGAVLIGSGAGQGNYYGGLGGLDVSYVGAPATMMLGANDGGADRTARTHNVPKYAIVAVPHYASGDQTHSPSKPMAFVLGYTSVSKNEIWVGGGSGMTSAATDVYLSTSANNTTDGGTVRVHVSSSGKVGIGMADAEPAAGLHVNDTMQVEGAATFNDAVIFNGPTHIAPQGDLLMGDFTDEPQS